MRRMYVASMLLFAYVSFFLLVLWLGICAEVDVDRITILPPPFLASVFIYLFLLLPTILSLTQKISARLKLVSVPFSSLLLDIGQQLSFFILDIFDQLVGFYYIDSEPIRARGIIVKYSRFIWLNESIILIRAETQRYDIVHVK